MGQKCDQFHAFAGVILRYPGENAVLSDKGRIQLKKQKRFQCHAILSEKSIALTAPRIVAIYLGNSNYFMIKDTFGRQSCAEQSVVQQSLDACTSENVSQLEQAMDEIYRSHSQGYQHDY